MATIMVGATFLVSAILMMIRRTFTRTQTRPKLERQYSIAPDVAVGIIYRDCRIISALDYDGRVHELQSAVSVDTLLTYSFSSGYELNIHCGHTNIGYSLEMYGDLLSIGALAVSDIWPRLSSELDRIGQACNKARKHGMEMDMIEYNNVA